MRKEEHHELIASLLSDINDLMRQRSGQFMVVGLDSILLQTLTDEISNASSLMSVFVKKDKDEHPDGKIFFIRLQNTSSMEYQALLYYYLELPLSHDCFVCLVSTSSLCINFFEKRVRSRFKNRIFFLPYDSLGGESCTEPCTSGCANHEIHRSLEMHNQCSFMRKYGLERYSLKYLFDLFEPVHFVLIIMAHNQKITLNKCYDRFRHVVSNVPELKRSPPGRILHCLYDLMDAGVINSGGSLAVDFGEFKEFIGVGAPLYIQRLLRTMDRAKD